MKINRLSLCHAFICPECCFNLSVSPSTVQRFTFPSFPLRYPGCFAIYYNLSIISIMKKGTRFNRVNWQQWDCLLGTMPDQHLANEIGCDRVAVSNRRKKLNIPLYREKSPDNKLIYCKCGCGHVFYMYDERNRPREFLPGHQSKNLRITLQCDNCGKEIKRQKARIDRVNKHFCSHKCEGEYSAKTGRRTGKLNGHYNTITVSCSGCGKPVSKAKSLIKRRNNRVYCPNCIPLTRKGRNGFYIGYPKEFSPSLRYKIRARDNFTCQNCFAHQDTVGTLHIHHIDYDKFNNNPMNLIALCATCHGQTNWALESWKEKFTQLLNHRYLSGIQP